MAGRSVRVRRAFALAAAVGGGITDAGYLGLISQQGTGMSGRVVFVAGFIMVMSAVALIGALAIAGDVRRADVLLLGSGGGFFGMGFIALFSIGAALILLGALVWIAAVPVRVSGRLAGASIAGSLALLLAGLMLTS